MLSHLSSGMSHAKAQDAKARFHVFASLRLCVRLSSVSSGRVRRAVDRRGGGHRVDDQHVFAEFEFVASSIGRPRSSSFTSASAVRFLATLRQLFVERGPVDAR